MWMFLTRAMTISLAALIIAAASISTGKASEKRPGTTADPALEAILKGIEECYLGTGFSARFHQTSTLAAMDIIDTATGRIFVKHPNRMRWEYEEPEKQIILTDGKTLWIHRPLDNQVMMGKAPPYLGGGQGGSFLSDIRTLRDQFYVSLESGKPGLPAVLKLMPKKHVPELADLLISVDPETFRITLISTRNVYKDETQIVLSEYRFDLKLDDSLFNMEIPKSTEVFELEGEK
jgi:outer membrane lipoprotein carrier protein